MIGKQIFRCTPKVSKRKSKCKIKLNKRNQLLNKININYWNLIAINLYWMPKKIKNAKGLENKWKWKNNYKLTKLKT